MLYNVRIYYNDIYTPCFPCKKQYEQEQSTYSYLKFIVFSIVYSFMNSLRVNVRLGPSNQFKPHEDHLADPFKVINQGDCVLSLLLYGFGRLLVW